MSEQTDVEDRTLRCSNCGKPFVWSVADQVFYKTQNYDQPKRCKECRQAKKALLAKAEEAGVTPRFSDINFKYTDARNEKIYTPEVIEDAFVDIQSCLTKILEPVFETHWIGNIRVSTEHKQFNIFKSRNPSAGFVSDLGCVISRGLISGFGINLRSDQQKT